MDHNLLVSELQALVLESKRRNPEVKDASEAALEILKSGPLGPDALRGRAAELLQPISLGCKTKTAKIIGISISALQRLVSLRGVPTSSLPEVLTTLNNVANQAVDIQLRILQTLLSILTFNPDVHDEVLGNILLLYFRLQDSRVSVVSSTSAATLRQAVMLIFDRVSSDTSDPSVPLTLPTDPPTELMITQSAMDAFSIFSDLCLLTGGGGAGGGGGLLSWAGGDKEKPRLLKLHGGLQRTFGLELIESILSGYEEGVKKRPELLFLLRHSLDPLLLKLQAEKPTFPISLRVCRLIFLLIRSFADQLPVEVETYLVSLLRAGTGEHDESEAAKKDASPPPWLRVLALEIIRGICGDIPLLRNIWQHYDAPSQGPKLFAKLVSALSRLMTEKPALLGVGAQMQGLGVPSSSSVDMANPASGYLDMGLGIVASAASVGVSTVSSMMAQTGGLSGQSAPKLKLIEQHDKAEAPLIPDTYVYLLALQSLDAIAQGIYFSAAQSGDAQPAITAMADSAWPALLAALSFSMSTNLSDQLFVDVLSALQDFTIVCGLLDLRTPRNAFLNTLARYAVPPPVVAAMQSYLEAPQTPRNNSVISADSLGFSALGVGGPTTPPGLSERNLACLRSTITASRLLASTLGDAWHDVLETLQNANFMLATSRKPAMQRRPTAASPQVGSSPMRGRTTPSESGDPRSEFFEDLDADSIHAAINLLFDSSRELEDEAFSTFIAALCRLSSEMIGMDANNSVIIDLSDTPHPSSPGLMSPSKEGNSRRRTSGINTSHSIKSGERSFSLTKLRVVATLNLSRIVSRDPEVAWATITQHLLAVARHLTAPSTIRIQASETLAELLLAAVRVGKDSRIQHQVFDVLVRQVDVYPISNTVSTDYDVRSSGYATLNHILESSGHSLSVGWQTIFGMLNTVCKQPPPAAATAPELARQDSQSSITSVQAAKPRPPMLFTKGDAALVRIAFPSLNLICTDFLSSLDPDAMRQCIACLGCFGRQREDVNITLAAIGLMWNVSDAVRVDGATVNAQERDQLWMYLLSELLALGKDDRLDVRSSAMQTLFRCVELYGAKLSNGVWEDVLWKIVFPLLEAAQGDEAHILALHSIGSILDTFLRPLSTLPSFNKVYQAFLDRIRYAFIDAPRGCCTAALKALEKVLLAVKAQKLDQTAHTTSLYERTWQTFTDMAAALSGGGEPYSQDNLLALVRVASVLHEALSPAPETHRQLSTILRSIMTYARSTDYRPDVDSMSPLQRATAQLVADSTVFPPSIMLADLAEFASLAYLGSEAGGKLSFVGLSKFALPALGEAFARCMRRDGTGEGLFADGTVERVIGAYSIPIKLKYDCPSANKFGEDPPLWRTAMTTFVPVLELVMASPALQTVSLDRFEGIWAQIIDLFGGLLLAETPAEGSEEDEVFVMPILDHVKAALTARIRDERVPQHLVEVYADILRRSSALYHFDVTAHGGTTAPAVSESQEQLRYWAFELLIASSTRAAGSGDDARRVAKLCLPSLVRRIEDALRGFVDDARLRGQMPFGRVREEELLYVLRHLVTMQLWADTLPSPSGASAIIAAATATSPRAHLFHFYALLLELSFLRAPLPSMWIFPDEHAKLWGGGRDDDELLANGHEVGFADDDETAAGAGVNAGDGGDLIEVNARDLARRCLELVGQEMGLGRPRAE